MKKRLLALALCLVMATSLLPLSAAAFERAPIDYVCITGSRFEKGAESAYLLKDDSWLLQSYTNDVRNWVDTGKTVGLYQDAGLTTLVKLDPVDGGTYYLKYRLHARDSVNGDLKYAQMSNSNCFLVVDGYSTAYIDCREGSENQTQDFIFQVTKNHNWRFTVSESNDTLTAQCQNQECRKEVSVSLEAHSVTLPDCPFNAQLAGKEQFETATGAAISKIRYDYKDSEGVWHYDVEPISANAKAGTYQAFVQISNLPRPVESDGVVAMAENPGGTYTADLYVHYTAADPAVTAQTGDNRPIELMLASVLVFSALAAAAFIADSKRRSHQ